MKNYAIIILILYLFWGCSSSTDTTSLSSEEHFNYAMSLYNDEDYEQALNEYQSILLQYPGSAVNDDAQYYLGMTYFQRDQFLLSAYEFSKLIRDIPASSFVPDAQYMLAESYFQLSPPYQLDQAYSKKAVEEFQTFVDFFPLNPRVEEAEKKIKELTEKQAEKEYKGAIIYEKLEYYNAAINYYGYVADNYHDTQFAPLALFSKIKLEISKDRIGAAHNDIATFLARYPDHPSAAEVEELNLSLSKNN